MESMKHVVASLDAIIENAENSLKSATRGSDAADAAPPADAAARALPESTPGEKQGTDSVLADGATADAPNGDGTKKQKKQKKKKVKTPAPPPVPPPVAQFLQCDLRIGRVTVVGEHPEAEALYALKVAYGEDEPERSVCAGLRAFVTPDKLQDALVVTICNLKPRVLRGVRSEAMILAGSVREGDSKEAVEALVPPVTAKQGDFVTVRGMQGVRTVVEGKNVSGKTWDKVVPRLVVKNGQAFYDGMPLVVGDKEITCALPDGAEIH